MMIITVLMLIFALSHSVLASKKVKDAIRNRWGERAYYGGYRLAYNLLAALLLAPVALVMYFQPGVVVWTLPDSLAPLLLAIQAGGLIGLVVSLLQIDLGQFTGISQLRAYWTGAPLPLPAEPLQTRGVYALVRHPLYLFSLMVLWSVSRLTDTLLVFNIAATLYFIIGSFYEERRLVVAFGQPYIDYQRRVAWLIPFLKLRRS